MLADMVLDITRDAADSKALPPPPTCHWATGYAEDSSFWFRRGFVGCVVGPLKRASQPLERLQPCRSSGKRPQRLSFFLFLVLLRA